MIGIIGKGFVGGAVHASYTDVSFYDPYKDGSVGSLEDLLSCTAIFLCVPTPQSESGECDTSIVESSLETLSRLEYKGVVISKSTAPYETYEKYAKTLNLAFAPEFLRAVTAVDDYLASTFMIVGCESEEVFEMVKHAINLSKLPCTTFKRITIREASLVKYFENSFLATKVSLFNEFYLLTKAVGANWDDVVEALTMDPRIENDHTQVPGPDGKFGWGGHCFPKDTSALVAIADKNGIDMKTLVAARKSNFSIRKSNF